MPFHRASSARIDEIDDVLRLAQQLIDADQRAIARTPAGAEISCRPDCSACCTQAVPVGPAELRAVFAAITELPDDQQQRIRGRIELASSALRSAGFAADDLTTAADSDERHEISMGYFRHRVPCPLLEDGVCSVRDARPLACREYLVRSDPASCADLGRATVVRLRSKRDVLRSYAHLEWDWGDRVTYILALALAEPPPESACRPHDAAAVFAELSAL